MTGGVGEVRPRLPVQVWVCPRKPHRDRGVDDAGEPVPTVQWREGVAYCATPGCGRSSVDDFSRR